MIVHNKTKAVCIRVFLESQCQSWIEFTSELNRNTPITKIYNKINRVNGKKKSSQIINLVNNEGENLTEMSDISNELAFTFAANSHDNNFHPDYKNIKSNTQEDNHNINEMNWTLFNKEITIKEIETTLKQCKNSSPGLDKIPNTLLKNLPLKALEFIRQLFNAI